MKIWCISDTHGKHRHLNIPDADMVICAGDFTSTGREDQVKNFLIWYASLDIQHKILIAGNHDRYTDPSFNPSLKQNDFQYMCEDLDSRITYLQDSWFLIDHGEEKIKIYGSPISPTFGNAWAWNRDRGEKIKKHWDCIPGGVDILVTHGPPQNVFDENVNRENVGCGDLLNKVIDVKPKYHIFGHIHEDGGNMEKIEEIGTTFINACCLNEYYILRGNGVEFDYES